MQKSVPGVVMRGGTSRGILFKKDEFPCFNDEEERTNILLSIFGTDIMRINGLGSTHSHGSKAMFIAVSNKEGVDIEYTYARVSVLKPEVEYNGNCGNLTSAVGPFSIDEGLVKPQEPITSIVSGS